MDNLLLHASTRQQAGTFLAKPVHAVLLTGQQGAGKGTLALHLAVELLGLPTVDRLANHPYFRHLHSPESSWSIDTVRNLNEFLRLKTTGDKSIRRVIILEDAQLLTVEAQNALLKLLEEPPADTVIILTTNSSHDLLPTILSRAQKLSVEPLSLETVREAFKQSGIEQTRVDRAYHMSNGGAGLIYALLSGDTEHPLAGHIAEAKAILKDTAFDRLCKVDQFSKQKSSIMPLVQALRRVSAAALVQAADKENTRLVKRWHTTVKRCYEAEVSLAKGGQPKLVLINLFLNI